MKKQLIKLADLIAPSFAPVHQSIKQGSYREYWLSGGRGSCKSTFVSIEIILGMISSPDANAIIYRKVADTLRESVYAQMIWAIDRLSLAHLWQVRLSPMELIYRPTGQKIVFRGADDPQKSKGIKLAKGFFGYLWFEELTEFHGMEDVRTIKASVIRGGNAITFYTYNPPMSAMNWVNEESLASPDGRLTHKSHYFDVPPAWLGSDFITEAQTLKQANERAYRHMYLGEVTGTGGQVFENLTIRPILDEEIQRMGAFYDGLDFGYYPDPSHWVRVSYDVPSQTLYLLDELRRYRTDDRTLAHLLKQDKKLTKQTEIIADSASEKPLADMRSEGLLVTGAYKGAGSVAMGIKWLITRAKIVIDPKRTPHSAKEFQQYEYLKNKKGEWLEGYQDKDNHAIDAVRYALNRVWMRKDR